MGDLDRHPHLGSIQLSTALLHNYTCADRPRKVTRPVGRTAPVRKDGITPRAGAPHNMHRMKKGAARLVVW